MSKIKRISILLLFTVLLLSGCDDTIEKTSYDYAIENGGGYRSEVQDEMGSVAPSDSSQLDITDNLESNSESKEEQKIISMLKLNAESKEFDNDIENLENKIHSLSGYISSHNVEKTEEGSRRGNVLIRVPQDKANSLIDFIEGNFQIVAESSQAVDVTTQYYDTETRIKNLESQEEQLRDLYKRTEKIEEIIIINDKLNEVVEEKESLVKSFVGMKDRISYSTVDITIREVSEFTIIDSIDDTTMEKITKALSNSWVTFKSGIVAVLVFIAGTLPAITLGIILLFIYKKYLMKYVKDITSITDNKIDEEKDDDKEKQKDT